MGAGLRSSGFILAAEEYETLAEDPNNLPCLMPLLGGEEVNSDPRQSHNRYAINFGSRSLDEANAFPVLLDIVRTRVKPDRDRQKDHGPGLHGKKYWWQYALRSDPLYEAIAPLPRCLVSAITTTHFVFSFQDTRQVFTHALVVFAFSGYGPFCCLQCRAHTEWARLLSSSLGRGLRYSVEDAFQTFRFPPHFEHDACLERTGQKYYKFRADLMARNDEGLTKTYNRFHGPNEKSEDILKLRELHDAMDRAVLDAYGWTDLQPTCEFLLDYDEEEEEPEPGKKPSKKKKPWRYRWPDDFRDEVLARLLDLNVKRAEEERLSGAGAATHAKAARKSAKSKAKKDEAGVGLFEDRE